MIFKIIDDIAKYFKVFKNTKIIQGEYPDLDIYKDKITCFLLAPETTFEEFSNESKLLTSNLEVYFIFQRETQANLKKLQADYLTELFKLIEDDTTLGNSVNYSFLSSVNIYDGIEGTKDAKGFKANLVITKEI